MFTTSRGLSIPRPQIGNPTQDEDEQARNKQQNPVPDYDLHLTSKAINPAPDYRTEDSTVMRRQAKDFHQKRRPDSLNDPPVSDYEVLGNMFNEAIKVKQF